MKNRAKNKKGVYYNGKDQDGNGRGGIHSQPDRTQHYRMADTMCVCDTDTDIHLLHFQSKALLSSVIKSPMRIARVLNL